MNPMLASFHAQIIVGVYLFFILTLALESFLIKWGCFKILYIYIICTALSLSLSLLLAMKFKDGPPRKSLIQKGFTPFTYI